jgi:Ca-activated chloride channel family protein
MSFIWPLMLLFLLLLPLPVFFYMRQQARRRKVLANYSGLGFMQAAGSVSGLRRHIPFLLFMLALIVMTIALARPQAVVSLPRVEGKVILAFDVSGSMAADDLQPTRMEAAKVAARAFIENQPDNILIGVVAFSNSGLAIQPPTADQDALFAAIDRLSPQLGTSLGQGILTSLTAIESDGSPDTLSFSNLTPVPTATPAPVPQGTFAPAAIVLLTDGENTDGRPDPLAVSLLAAERGVRIYTVGIGSPQGAILNVEGFSVHTRLDELMLQQISQITQGEYYNAQTEEDLSDIYANLDTQLIIKPEEMEVTSLFAGASVLLLLIGGALSLLWFGRVP